MKAQFSIVTTLALWSILACSGSPQHQQAVKIGISNHTIINDKFANTPFGKRIRWENKEAVLRPHYQLIKHPVLNEYSNKLDTFYLWTDQQDSIIFYKMDKSFWLNTAIFKTNYQKLDKGIEVGMRKIDFMSKMNITAEKEYHKFIIENEDKYAVHTFIFNKKNILEKVELFFLID